MASMKRRTDAKAGRAVAAGLFLLVSGIVLVGVSGGIGSTSGSSLPPGSGGTVLPSCTNLSGIWSASDAYVTYACTAGGPALTVPAAGSYSALIQRFDAKNASQLWLYHVAPSMVLSKTPAASCADLAGAALLYTPSSPTNPVTVTLGATPALGTGYNYCVVTVAGATNVVSPHVGWSAATSGTVST